ncbi:MAG: hypothetical protein GX345_07220 [Clostridiales bacterium]|nr:hypothetical protein [Clostridiales bacterium]
MGKIKSFLNSKIIKTDVGHETVLTWRETLSYGLGRGAQGMSTSTMSSGAINYFLTNLMSISPGTVANIRLWTGLWDAINDPIMGILVDKTRTKDGKMRPYIKIAPFICAFFTSMLFFNQSSFPPWLRLAFAIVALVGWDMSYTAFDIPMGALAFSITPSGVERTKLFGISGIMRAVSAAITGAIVPIALTIPYFKTQTGRAYTAAAIVAFFGIILFSRPAYHNTRERADHSEDSPTAMQCVRLLLINRPLFMLFLANMAFLLVTAQSATQMYFAIDLVGDSKFYLVLQIALAPAPILAGLIVPWVVQKLGSKADFKKLYIYSCLLAASMHLLLFLTCAKPLMNLETGQTPSLLVIILCMAFTGFAAFPLEFKNLLGKEMEAETVDYVEWKSGERVEGIMLSLMSFTGKLTNSVSSAIALAILGFAAYVTHEDAIPVAQTPRAKFALLSLQTLVPLLGYLLMLIPIFFYNISRKDHDKMMEEILKRRALKQEALEDQGNNHESL